MSEYQKKSEDYEKAAVQLYTAKLYSAVGHTAYYSCFLLLEHIWKHKMSMTKEDLYALCSDSPNTHDRLINEIRDYIRDDCSEVKEHLKDSHNLHNNIVKLKRLRMMADYDDCCFNKMNSFSSITAMSYALPILKKYV